MKYPWNKSNGRRGGGMNEVYAAPDFLFDYDDDKEEQEQEKEQEKEQEQEQEQEQKQEKEPDGSQMEGVYAGPPAPPAPQFMCTYAGPEFFNGMRGGFAGAPAPSGKFCSWCGTPAEPGHKFCPRCGKKLGENTP